MTTLPVVSRNQEEFTLGGTYAMKQETWRGRLVPAMAADLIALDRDPFAAVMPSLRGTNTLMTMVRGEIRHNTQFRHGGAVVIYSSAGGIWASNLWG
jgi:hypothetical protein